MGQLRPGDEVITPAVTWATTVWPIANLGLTPVPVDVGPETFTIDPAQVEAAITPKTRAILLVHLLGRPCDMEAITAIARRHDLVVIEDCCEAHGASYRGKKVGSFGLAGTYSFYFSHHISTIEGGMIVTDDDELAQLPRSLRAFGWTRDWDNGVAPNDSDFDPRFLFVNVGFNLRPTEIQGAFGIHQLGRLDGFVAQRRANTASWGEQIGEGGGSFVVHREDEGTKHAWFAYPLLVEEGRGLTRTGVQAHLEMCGVETRPVMAGNIARQPAMRLVPHRIHGQLAKADQIHRRGFLIRNHHRIGPVERELVLKSLLEAEAGTCVMTAARRADKGLGRNPPDTWKVPMSVWGRRGAVAIRSLNQRSPRVGGSRST